MNAKLNKVNQEIERARAKIAELQALLPVLEKQRTQLENAEWIKALRSADVAPENFNAFVESFMVNMGGGIRTPEQPKPRPKAKEDTHTAPRPTIAEDKTHDDEV